MDNKKVLGVSIAAVVILVIAIVATSYAAFTANITGTQENKLSTGYVKMNCAETNFTLSDTKPLTDAQGIALSNNAATCTLTTEMNGTMTVGYDIAMDAVDATTPNDALGINNVKVQVAKSKDGGATSYVAGTSASAGALVSSLTSAQGTYDKSITSYKLDSDTLEGEHEVLYTIKAWVDSGAAGESTTNASQAGVCSDAQYKTQKECTDNGEIWGNSQTTSQAGSSFSFKLKLGATQVLS